MLSGEIRARSGQRELPVIKEGDEKNGRSAYNEHLCKRGMILQEKKHRVVMPGTFVICSI